MTVEGAVIVVEGGAVTVTLTGDALPEQPFTSVTVTPYDPLVLATIDCVVAPVDHEYDCPAVAVSVTLPPVQKLVGPLVLIVGVKLPTATLALPLLLQPFAATTTLKLTGLEAPAVKVIALVFWPPLIVPPLIVQAYVAPLCAATLAALPVEFAQVDDGAAIVALG